MNHQGSFSQRLLFRAAHKSNSMQNREAHRERLLSFATQFHYSTLIRAEAGSVKRGCGFGSVFQAATRGLGDQGSETTP